jgi:hypothetical protein
VDILCGREKCLLVLCGKEGSLLLVVVSPLCSYPRLHTAQYSSSPLRCHKPALLVFVPAQLHSVLIPPMPSRTSLLSPCTHATLAFLHFSPLLATKMPQTGSHSHRAHATLVFSHFSPPRHRELSGGRLPRRRTHDPCRATIDRLEPCTGSPGTLHGPSQRLTPCASTAVVPETRCLLETHCLLETRSSLLARFARFSPAVCCAGWPSTGGSLRGRDRGAW